MDREIQFSTDFRGVGLCSEVSNLRMERGFISKNIGADTVTGLMNSRTVKNFVLSQSVHCQDPKNEMSLGTFDLELLSQMKELLVSHEAADTKFKVSLT